MSMFKIVCYSVEQFLYIVPRGPADMAKHVLDKDMRALFVMIEKGRVTLAIALVNRHFTNDWHDKVTLDAKSPRALLELGATTLGYRFTDQYRYWPKLENWRRNGQLVRGEEKRSMSMFSLATLVDDILVRQMNENAPIIEDTCLWLNSHDFALGAGIGSMCVDVRADLGDYLIPTWDDLTSVEIADENMTLWHERAPIAVWRGSTTGNGDRLKLVQFAKDHNLLVDAQIVKWNTRPRIVKNVVWAQLPIAGVEIGEYLSSREQACKYKYAIVIDGNVAAFRVRAHLAMGMCCLILDSPFRTWYSHLLVPWKHFVPVKNIEDLVTKIEWCRANDTEVHEIARRGHTLFLDSLLQKHVDQFFVCTINKFAAQTVPIWNRPNIIKPPQKVLETCPSIAVFTRCKWNKKIWERLLTQMYGLWRDKLILDEGAFESIYVDVQRECIHSHYLCIKWPQTLVDVGWTRIAWHLFVLLAETHDRPSTNYKTISEIVTMARAQGLVLDRLSELPLRKGVVV